MKQIALGTSDVKVTNLGLGCINFGTTTKEEDAHRLIEAYVSRGGNLLDTSNNYAFWNGGDGRESERVLGHWLKKNPSLRKNLVVATKLGARPKDLTKGFDDVQGNGRSTIYEEVEKSLETLHVDTLDLLYLHTDDWNTPLEETLSALNDVIKKGYVKLIGCSNFRTFRIEQARQICKEHDYPFFSAVQQRYTYLQPVADADFGVQVAADSELKSYFKYYNDLTFVSHTSLLYGVYFGQQIEDINYDTRWNRKRLEEVQAQKENRVPWVLKKITEDFGGSVALFTSSKIEHLIQNIEYFEKDE